MAPPGEIMSRAIFELSYQEVFLDLLLKKLEEREQVIGIIKKTVEVKKGITKGISIVEAQETNEVSLVYKEVAKKLITKSEV